MRVRGRTDGFDFVDDRGIVVWKTIDFLRFRDFRDVRSQSAKNPNHQTKKTFAYPKNILSGPEIFIVLG